MIGATESSDLATMTVICIAQGFVNIAFCLCLLHAQIQNSRLKRDLHQREKWHDKELAKWRNQF